MYPLEMQVDLLVMGIVLGLFVVSAIRIKRIDLQDFVFLGGLFCYAASDIYWVLLLLLTGNSDYTMMTAVNIAEAGAMLFLTSMMQIREQRRFRLTPFVGGAILYLAACTGLWIAWNGHWIVNILSFAWYLPYVSQAALRMEDRLTRHEKMALLYGVAVLIAAQLLTLAAGGGFYEFLNWLCFALCLAGTLLFLLHTLRPFREGLIPAMALHLWAILWVYQSDGIRYSIARTFLVLSVVLVVVCYLRERGDRA